MKNDFLQKVSFFQWGIAQKFILCILIFSAVVTVLLAAVQLYIGYRSGIESINKSIRLVGDSYLKSIENSLWVYDTELLKTQLNGMLKLSDMQYIDVIHKDEILAKSGVLKDTRVIRKEFSLSNTYKGKTMSLGTLRVVYTLENIYDRLIRNAIGIIIFQSIIIFLVSGFVFFIFYLLVARHIFALVKYTRSLKVDTLQTPFTLRRSKIQLGKDELDVLVNTINQMRINLNDSYSQLKGEIFDRIQAEDALKKSEAHLRALTNSLPDLVWLKDSDGVYRYCNSKFERFFGAKEKEIVGKRDCDFVEESLAEFFRKNDALAIAAGRPSMSEKSVSFADDGHTESLEIIMSPMYDSKGILIGVLGVGRDVTERKKDEEEKVKLKSELQQAQKMESIGNLAGGIAHDFNNLLFPILGNAEMLLEDLSASSIEHENVQEIYNAGIRASELVQQILAFSRQSEHKMTPVRVQNILAEVLKLIRSAIPTNIEIHQSIQADCGSIKADATQIHQVAMNLITNAYHAVEEKNGCISVTLKQIEVGKEALTESTPEEGRYLLLSISDTGIGIEPEMIGKIFEPYFTTKKQGKGTGLGLAVVFGIIKEHQGDIKVYSEPGKGTTFNVCLPLMKQSAETGFSEQIKKTATGSERILLVDDEASVARLEGQLLSRLGYSVVEQTSSLEALNVFKSNPDDFDLVLSDMTMPDMTGDQLAKEILSVKPELPIIICTGFSERINKEHAEAIGVKGFLMKPVVRFDMAQMVRKVLDDSKNS